MTTKTNKELKDLNYTLHKDRLETHIVFEDETEIYIFIEVGMIYVCSFDYEELERRINNEDIDSFESYDTTDTIDYYMNSEYYEYINCSLLHIMNNTLK